MSDYAEPPTDEEENILTLAEFANPWPEQIDPALDVREIYASA
jgi:hypothetical protein